MGLAYTFFAQNPPLRSMPVHGGENVWIHLLENHDGIIFSDGQFASGQKRWSTSVKEWLIACDERQHAPKFDFVDDRPAAASTEDGKSPLLLWMITGMWKMSADCASRSCLNG